VNAAHPRTLVHSLLFTAALLGLISFSIEAAKGYLALLVIGSVAAIVAAFHYLFKGNRFFGFALANLTGVYACVFLFFVESNFRAVDLLVLWIGFVTPLLAFLGGSLWRRRSIEHLIASNRIRDESHFARVLAWLVPVFAVGVLTFLLPQEGISKAFENVAFLGAMAAIGGIVVFVSRDVAVFLLDTALLFEHFFQRIARLIAPAFAFLTFYSLLVIVFAASYSVIDRISAQRNFRIDGVVRTIDFPESLYFSLTTLSTAAYGDIFPVSNAARVIVALEIVCGILLLLFGFNEIISYSRQYGDLGRAERLRDLRARDTGDDA
jgi:voltage-gated potassium channel